MTALLLALEAAGLIGVCSLVVKFIFRKTWKRITAMTRQKIRLVMLRLGYWPRHDLQIAVYRLAVKAARESLDKNPDQELIREWMRWFLGNPDATIDYSLKNFRDLYKEPLWKVPPEPLDYSPSWKEIKK